MLWNSLYNSLRRRGEASVYCDTLAGRMEGMIIDEQRKIETAKTWDILIEIKKPE